MNYGFRGCQRCNPRYGIRKALCYYEVYRIKDAPVYEKIEQCGQKGSATPG